MRIAHGAAASISEHVQGTQLPELRGASDDALLGIVQDVLSRKHASLGGHASAAALAESSSGNRAMIRIGG